MSRSPNEKSRPTQMQHLCRTAWPCARFFVPVIFSNDFFVDRVDLKSLQIYMTLVKSNNGIIEKLNKNE